MLNRSWIFIGIMTVAAVCYAIYRDANLITNPSGDLRNRIVGARLQKDGHIPYMYKWQSGDEMKYFDSEGDYSSEINAITATPFFHTLLYPLTGFKIIDIFRIWAAFQYIMLFCLGFICWRFACTTVQRRIVIVTCILLIFTEAWMNSIVSGQLYLMIPLLYGCFLFCVWKNNSFYSIIAGLFAVSLVLVRPNTLFIFLPFLVFIKGTTLRQICLFLIVPALFMLYILGSEHQRDLWISYKATVVAHTKSHQRDKHEIPKMLQDQTDLDHNTSTARRIFYSENGNFFVLVKKLTGIKLSATFLMLATFIVVALLLALFLKTSSNNHRSLYICGIFGACLYMIADLFSPIHRHQYYTVQWFFPLLLAAALYQKRWTAIYIILAIGLFLNIINTPLIKMEHTLGEYMWLVALLILAFVYNATTLGKSIRHLNQPIAL